MFSAFPNAAISPPRHNQRVSFNSEAGLQHKAELERSATVLIEVAALSTEGYSYVKLNVQTAEGVLLFAPN